MRRVPELRRGLPLESCERVEGGWRQGEVGRIGLSCWGFVASPAGAHSRSHRLPYLPIGRTGSDAAHGWGLKSRRGLFRVFKWAA